MPAEPLFAVPDPGDDEAPADEVSSSAVGQIAEYRAVAELLARGHRVARPVVDDDGVDLIVDYGTTVQVKSTSGWDAAKGRFRFHTRSGSGIRQQYRAGAVKVGVPANVDVLLCHSLAEGLWWVMPAEALERRSNANVVPGNRLDHYRDNWRLFEEFRRGRRR